VATANKAGAKHHFQAVFVVEWEEQADSAQYSTRAAGSEKIPQGLKPLFYCRMFRHGSLDSAPFGFAQGKRDKFRRALTIREGAPRHAVGD
jgi:hypothetical protein